MRTSARPQEQAFLSTEFWQDRRLGLDEFLTAFHQRFQRGQVTGVTESAGDAAGRPNHRLVMLVVPKQESTRLEAFLINYARTHNADRTRRPRSSYAD